MNTNEWIDLASLSLCLWYLLYEIIERKQDVSLNLNLYSASLYLCGCIYFLYHSQLSI